MLSLRVTECLAHLLPAVVHRVAVGGSAVAHQVVVGCQAAAVRQVAAAHQVAAARQAAVRPVAVTGPQAVVAQVAVALRVRAPHLVGLRRRVLRQLHLGVLTETHYLAQPPR